VLSVSSGYEEVKLLVWIEREQVRHRGILFLMLRLACFCIVLFIHYLPGLRLPPFRFLASLRPGPHPRTDYGIIGSHEGRVNHGRLLKSQEPLRQRGAGSNTRKTALPGDVLLIR